MADLKSAMKAGRELTPYEKFRNRLDQLKPEIAALTGAGLVEPFCRTVLNAVQARPELLEADGKSLFLACMDAAQDGLLPNGHEAVLNIFSTKVKVDEGDRQVERWIKKVQYMPMVGGLVKKLYESKIATFVDAVAVYERDEFAYERGDNPRIIHKPYGGRDEPGEIVAAYAIVKLTNGEVKREVMWWRDIEKAHKASTNYKNSVKYEKAETGPWVDWPDQMAIKSVLHRVDKQLPSAPAVEHVMNADFKASGYVSDLALLPETAGGDPVPTGASTVGKDDVKEHAERQEVRDEGGGQPLKNEDAEEVRKDPPPPPQPPTEEQIKKLLESTNDIDMLHAHADLIREVPIPESEKGKKNNVRMRLMMLYDARKAALGGAE